MKHKIIGCIILITLFPSLGFAQANKLCLSKGYTVLTLNGIYTNEKSADTNKRALEDKLPPIHNNQEVIVDYLHNKSHIGGAGDIFKAAYQKVFDWGKVEDYDLMEMLRDASQKISTQKVLLVAHSQGNFYANSFYDKVAGRPGGVPKQSIGVYGVASPASRVAGGGKYLTSSTDKLINELRIGNLLRILPSNVDIKLPYGDTSNGHGFSSTYLKYQGARIVSDVKMALNRLSENSIQAKDVPCIAPPQLSTFHEVKGTVLGVLDHPVDTAAKAIHAVHEAALAAGKKIIKVASSAGSSIKNIFKSQGANVIGSLPDAEELAIATSPKDAEAASPLSEKNKKGQKQEKSSINVTSMFVPEQFPEKESQELSTGEDKPSQFVSGESVKRRSRGSGAPTQIVEVPDEEAPIVLPPLEDELPETEPEPQPESPEPDLEQEPELQEPQPEETSDYANLYPSDLNDNGIPDKGESEVIMSSNKSLPTGEYRFKSLTITNGAVLKTEGDPTSTKEFKGVKITAVNLNIDNGASISADNEGYGPDQGPGVVPALSAVSNPGASYGGRSFGSQNDATYGSAIRPIYLGSGGAGSNHGGGALHLSVSTLTNNGTVSASGGESASGGSIYVTANHLKGNGIFRANGGQLYQAGHLKSPGGGGRIAVFYNDSTFEGIVEAKGGCGSYNSLTILCSEDGTAGAFDLPKNDLYVKGGSWKFLKDDEPFSFEHIFITDGAKVSGEEDVSIRAYETVVINEGSALTLSDGQNLNTREVKIDGGSILTLSGDETISTSSLSLEGNSTVTVMPEKVLHLDIPNISIESGSAISVNGKGYLSGPGTPIPSLYYAGASYGGVGAGNTPASAYGSESEPVDFGSGSFGNFRGGGAIRLIVSNTLSNDGTISANGDPTSSGGSVYITAKNISGSGTISANGGGNFLAAVNQAPGGGGRVAVYYETSAFTGQAYAHGGETLQNNPGTGTIKMVNTSLPPEPEEQTETIPSITRFTLNGIEGDVGVDPVVDPVTLHFTANENVDWVSVEIENESNEDMRKIFLQGSTCLDGTNTCKKVWNGALSDGTPPVNGIYAVKVRFRDMGDAATDYDYFSPYKIIVDNGMANMLQAEDVETGNIDLKDGENSENVEIQIEDIKEEAEPVSDELAKESSEESGNAAESPSVE